ncbi:type II secretion system minor pseudopilin GspJ [Psychromonas ossibalaenae]|uniref:type II secretion system minor pseudopilin GspJ n=1 Tax=Psychromonas ossibalaenae TaxID=444922 RepID=UPI00035E1305|nr:type II secretion system minor pseudopilin GspJ [Psychromonas ossibalaenae]
MLSRNFAPKVHSKGFTLLEILVAISIFSLLSLVAYQILQGVLQSGEISKKHSERLTELQRAMLIIEQDFTQIVARTSREDGLETENFRALRVDKELFESDDQGIEFNRLGWTNPLGLLPRSEIVRVRYLIKEGQLQRLYFLYPDIVVGQEPEMQVLLEDVTELTFRFWNNGWQDTWDSPKSLPEGIEINITSEHFSELRRVFLISAGEVLQ